jgi:hypothetical protein
MRAGVKRRGDGTAVREAEAIQQVESVLALTEVQRACGAFAVDLDAEEKRGGPEVAQLEALSEQALISAIFSFDLDASVMSSTNTGTITFTPSFSQMNTDESDRMRAKPCSTSTSSRRWNHSRPPCLRP